MKSSEELKKNGFVVVRNVIHTELSGFLTRILFRRSESNKRTTDTQVKNALSYADRTEELDSLLEKVWPDMEGYVGEPLLPTYSYSRIYTTGNYMPRHTDKDTCEVSITIQLRRSHEYSYPIFMNGKELCLKEGDGVIYYGNKVPHWRDVCCGPEGYFSGQVFLHYVRENGEFNHLAGDPVGRKNQMVSFNKNRHFML